MRIIEIKNNLVKINYDAAQENIILSGFVVIKDENQSFIGQIMHLEANSKGNFAILKLVFNFDSQGVVTSYNGSIPNAKSSIETVSAEEILELMPVQSPIVMGELSGQNTILKLDRSVLQEKLLVCCEKPEERNLFIKNLQAQLEHNSKKLLIFDLLGDSDYLSTFSNKIVAGEDFKLPLNYETINFIYEKGLDDANAESKALIQDVFLEVQNYVKTLADKFIPFELFKNVVDEQYEELGLVELVLLKNKLLKYYEAGVFAQSKEEFSSLEKAVKSSNTTLFDLSNMEEKIQREIISYAVSKLPDDVYVMVNVTNKNSDKKLLKQIFMTKSINPIVICSYSYKYLLELKQLSRNFVLFQPMQQQNDFASYNTFLNKLNADDFIVYGFATNHLPLIVQLNELPQRTFEEVSFVEAAPEVLEEVLEDGLEDSFVEEFSFQPEIEKTEDIGETEKAEDAEEAVANSLDEQIKKDVDAFYTRPKQEVIQESAPPEDVVLTEDDLDFIDDLNLVQSAEDTENADGTQEAEDVSITDEDDFLTVDSTEFLQYEDDETESKEAQIVEEVLEAAEDNFLEETVINNTSSQFEQVMQKEAQGVKGASSQNVQNVQDAEILPASVASTPIVPIYSANVEPSEKASMETFEQGDSVIHAKYGKGTVEKLISYGNKTLCSINFDNVGRRLLDPTLAELQKG